MVAPLRNRQQQQQQQRAPPPAYDEPFADEKGPSAAAAGSRGSGRFSAVLVSSLLTALSLVTFHLLLSSSSSFPFPPSSPKPEPARPPPTHIVRGLALCQTHSSPVGPPADFAAKRERSDRFELGTKAVWIRNATIWTGANDGAEVLREGEVVLDQGIIRYVGLKAPVNLLRSLEASGYTTLDAGGQWVTPGLVDMHSHAGIGSMPALEGADDTNSFASNANPQLRALDGMNSHDLSFETITAGGVTSSLILPGSADSIGGQAFVFKFRPPKDNSVSAMVVEPPFAVDETSGNWTRTGHVRHMKHAFGENPSRSWHQGRMDSAWDLRKIYDEARSVKLAQDAWCAVAETAIKERSGDTSTIGSYPESPLRLEALIDTLRGKVLVNAHCYEGTDMDALVRLSNEFQFRFAAVHHAHEAHLVPGLLKRMWQGPPGAAIFATFSRYKREAYRHSVHAARILADAGIAVAMKSDHPGIDSRYVLHEAVQAHHHGLDAALALRAVTTTPAELLGKSHRIGSLKVGYDADVVIWQSHPLQLGATPAQVFVDGIPQLESPNLVARSPADQEPPSVPDYSGEIREVIDSRGETELGPTNRTNRVVFVNVRSVVLRDGYTLKEHVSANSEGEIAPSTNVVVEAGEIICIGADCRSALRDKMTPVIDLEGGSIGPGLIAYGASVGLGHIDFEGSTGDAGLDAFELGKPPSFMRHASDALVFDSKQDHVALRAGVTHAISPPSEYIAGDNVFKGFSVFHSLSAPHRLAPGAVLSKEAGLSITIGHTGTPLSAQISLLREVLTEKVKQGERNAFQKAIAKVTAGKTPLVISVNSADQMATLLELKTEVEAIHNASLRLVFFGAKEAHLLATELAEANVAVIVGPARAQPMDWDSRRVLAGAPLTAETVLSTLKKAGVDVAVGVPGFEPPFGSAIGTMRWTLAFTQTDSVNSPFANPLEALSLATVSLERLLGLGDKVDGKRNWVATSHGRLLDLGAKVVAVGAGGEVLLF